MSVGHRFNQVLVEVESAGDGPGNLRHFQRVGEAGHVMVAGGRDEHLSLVLEPPEGLGVDNPV